MLLSLDSLCTRVLTLIVNDMFVKVFVLRIKFNSYQYNGVDLVIIV